METPVHVNPNKLTTADFYFGQTLGEGAYARVVHAKMKAHATNQFAIKIMEKNHIKKENKVKYVMMEKAVLAKLSHTFIIRLYYTFQDTSNLYMCMELLPGGELLQYILKRRKDKEKSGVFGEACDLAATKFYIAEIVEGIEYMHREKVIHRDLKPENVLLTANGHVKIGDFGTATIIRDAPKNTTAGESEEDNDENRSSFVGTAEYVSPEILQDREVTPAADIWAIGCIAYQMLYGKPPFRGESEYLTFQNIITHCDGSQPLPMPTRITSLPVAHSFISQCLQPVAVDRYGIGAPAPEKAGAAAVGTVKGHKLFEGVSFSELESQTAPYQPDPSTFPSTENMFDGSSDDWQMGVEPTFLSSKRSSGDTDDLVTSVNSSRYGAQAQFEKDKWKQFLREGEHQVLCAPVYKRKGLFSKKRQLILTDRPRLIYADAEKMELKGEVPWTPNFPLSVNILNSKQFDVVCSTTGRNYHFTVLEENTPQIWCDLVAAMVEKMNDLVAQGLYVADNGERSSD